jgi:hypothetical protein
MTPVADHVRAGNHGSVKGCSEILDAHQETYNMLHAAQVL